MARVIDHRTTQPPRQRAVICERATTRALVSITLPVVLDIRNQPERVKARSLVAALCDGRLDHME